jgi:hypothetical protein
LAVEDAAKYCQRRFDLDREENETFALSLAELIVLECCREITQEPFSAGAASAWLKDYFGVKNESNDI